MTRKTSNVPDSLHSRVVCENFKVLRFGLLHGSHPNQVFVLVRFRNPNFALDTEVEIPLSLLRESKLKDFIPPWFTLEDVPPERTHKIGRAHV